MQALPRRAPRENAHVTTLAIILWFAVACTANRLPKDIAEYRAQRAAARAAECERTSAGCPPARAPEGR